MSGGSGTTPTLFGSQDDLIGICDNADTQVNLFVLDRETGAQVCQTPLFSPGESACENSIVGYEDEVVVPNNSGFTGATDHQNTVNPGLHPDGYAFMGTVHGIVRLADTP